MVISKIFGSFSKIYKNYSKEKISRVVPVNIILSPFPYGFHPYNGEMHEGDLRVSLTHSAQGNSGKREEERRERGEKERKRERNGERIVVGRSQRRLLASRRLDSKEQSFARSNERSLIRV